MKKGLNLLGLVLSFIFSFSTLCVAVDFEFPPHSIVVGLSGHVPQARNHFKVSYEGGSFYVEHQGKKRQLQDCFIESVLRQIDPSKFVVFVQNDNKLKVVRAHDGGFGLELLGQVKGGILGMATVIWGTKVSLDITAAALLAGGAYLYNKATGSKKSVSDTVPDEAWDAACGYDRVAAMSSGRGGRCGRVPEPVATVRIESVPEHLVPMEDLVHRKGGAFWGGLKPHKGKTRTNGKTGKSRRYYELDRLHVKGGHHGEVEVFQGRKNGKHLGTVDSETGETTGGPVKGRKWSE